jgi:hypothetical protein
MVNSRDEIFTPKLSLIFHNATTPLEFFYEIPEPAPRDPVDDLNGEANQSGKRAECHLCPSSQVVVGEQICCCMCQATCCQVHITMAFTMVKDATESQSRQILDVRRPVCFKCTGVLMEEGKAFPIHENFINERKLTELSYFARSVRVPSTATATIRMFYHDKCVSSTAVLLHPERTDLKFALDGSYRKDKWREACDAWDGLWRAEVILNCLTFSINFAPEVQFPAQRKILYNIF